MKKRLLAVLAAALVITTLLSVVSFADFGDYAGDSDWGFDSGSDWGGGSDWDYDYGSDYDSDYYYSFGSGSGSYSGGNFFWTLVVFVAIVAIAVLGNGKRFGKTGKNGKVNLGRQQPEKPLVNRIDELKKKDPNFSEAKFLDDAANLYVRMQNCWTAKDLEPVRPHLTTELYAKSDRQIQAYKNNHQTDHVERISVLDTRIVGCDADNVNDIITVQLTARIVDYVTNDDTGAIIRGSNSKELFMTYQWTFIRSLGKTTGESGDIDSEHCPNCGAPIDLNQSAVCPYCGATVTSGDYDWVVSNIRGISQRSN